MRRAKKPRVEKYKKSPVLNIDDFNWCIANDFQVYVKPLYNNGPCKIAVRRKGITTGGRDWAYINGIRIESKETLGEKSFKNQEEAEAHLNYVYSYLRRKYGSEV